MSTRLIIEGNAVYEIDESCRGCGKRYGGEQSEAKEKKPEEKDKRNYGEAKQETPF